MKLSNLLMKLNHNQSVIVEEYNPQYTLTAGQIISKINTKKYRVDSIHAEGDILHIRAHEKGETR